MATMRNSLAILLSFPLRPSLWWRARSRVPRTKFACLRRTLEASRQAADDRGASTQDYFAASNLTLLVMKVQQDFYERSRQDLRAMSGLWVEQTKMVKKWKHRLSNDEDSYTTRLRHIKASQVIYSKFEATGNHQKFMGFLDHSSHASNVRHQTLFTISLRKPEEAQNRRL